MSKQRIKLNKAKIIFFVIPNLIFIVTVVLFATGILNLEELGDKGGVITGNYFSIILFCVSILLLGLIPLTPVFTLWYIVEMPIVWKMFGFDLAWCFVWLVIIALLIANIDAFFYKFINFEEEKTIISHHYEGKIEGNKVVNVKEVEDRSSNGGYIANLYIWYIRSLCILVAGIYIVFREIKKGKKLKPENQNESGEES